MTKDAYIHGTDPTEQKRLAELNRLTNPAFLDFLRLSPNDLVLEVGSGLGILASQVADRLTTGKIIGVECSPDQLAAARKTFLNSQDVGASTGRPNLQFQRADAHSLSFKQESFEVVYCRYLLEHVADPLRVLEEMRRVLKPDGRVVVQENNILVNVLHPDCTEFDSVWRKFVALQERLGGDALIGKKLFALMKQAGFRDITLSLAPEVHQAGQEGFRVWIENLIGNVAGAADRLMEFGFASRLEIEEALSGLRRFGDRGDASAIFYWNRAVGRK